MERAKELVDKQSDEARVENSNLPPTTLIGGGRGKGEEERVESGTGDQSKTREDGENVQAESEDRVECMEAQDEENSEGTPLADAQVAKRPASELSSDTVCGLEKRGRAEELSDTSSDGEYRVFPPDSPNEVSFLNIALQSTPKDRAINKALQQRPTPRRQRGNTAQYPPLVDKEVKEELVSKEVMEGAL